MTTRMVPVMIPEPLYRRLERTSATIHRPVNDVVATTLAAMLPPSPDLPEALADELSSMVWLSDEKLYSATQPTFTPTMQARLATLNEINDERPLTPSEKKEQMHLLAQYERSILRRAQAYAILAQRGHLLPDNNELPSVS
ncbi:MAG TPA: hypothetical protein PLH19_13220 [Anaerolineae bacterium]|nr:hypothetical protein [Anaerolineae bacterium]HQH39479.1 hypothetical protein [Anaerolineae bacterium]